MVVPTLSTSVNEVFDNIPFRSMRNVYFVYGWNVVQPLLVRHRHCRMYGKDFVRIWTWFFLHEFTMGQLSVPWVNFLFHGSTFHGSNCVSIRSTFLSVNVLMGLLSVGQTSNGSTYRSPFFGLNLSNPMPCVTSFSSHHV